jgi:hypothetical protein
MAIRRHILPGEGDGERRLATDGCRECQRLSAESRYAEEQIGRPNGHSSQELEITEPFWHKLSQVPFHEPFTQKMKLFQSSLIKANQG